METQKDKEKQLARRRASDPRFPFISRREVKAKKDALLERIIRDLEQDWHSRKRIRE